MRLKIRDKRNKGWFWLDNDYLNGYAKVFGPVGTSVYLSICRHVDTKTQKCFPSQSFIAQELGISDRTVRKYLQLFIKHSLMEVEKERKGGKWLNNIYSLSDKTEWDSPSEISSYGYHHRNIVPSPSEIDDINHRNTVPTKETHRKDTNRRKEQNLNVRKNERIRLIKRDIRSLVSNTKVHS